VQDIVSIVLYVLIFILGITLLNALLGPKLKKTHPLLSTPFVSVLVPARNEEKNIGRCLDSLLNQDYPNYEIIVLNDYSEDKTEDIIKKYTKKFEKVKLISGKQLKSNWTGKNWACHQLSEMANGDVFIFTDADTWHSKTAVINTIAWMQKLKLGLFSAFPQQLTKGFAEKLVIPSIDVFVYGILPLWLTYYSRFSSISAANGQWIALTKNAYKLIGGHEALKNKVVEDVEFARTAKKNRIKILTTSGTEMVFCRMYHSTKEVWEGFSKNVYGLVGYNVILFLFIVIGMILFFLSPFVFIWFPGLFWISGVVLVLNFSIRLIIAKNVKSDLIYSVLFYPFGILFLLAIGFNSFSKMKNGIVTWKGRDINVKRC
jgi:chlorobactene glucosyltransferase